MTSNQIDLDELKANLKPSDIISILRVFFSNLRYEETNSFLLLPTICHHEHQEDASFKLYYYYNTQLFFCYTQCDGSFDIYEMVKKMLFLRGDNGDDFNLVLDIILNNSSQGFIKLTSQKKYESVFEKVKKSDREIKLIEYSENALAASQPIFHSSWIEEGISKESMKKYGIRYSISKEQIVIPHYDRYSRLVGIRVRNLLKEDIARGKYMPASINGQMFSHPLSCNLYGINFNEKAIQRTKTAYVFEGEKSVLLTDTWYGDNNISVATCGKKLNKIQVLLLMALGVQNLVLCYDKMYQNKAEESKYYKELYDICKKYKNYMNMSFLFDRYGLLEYKSAPVDRGQEIFERLLEERVII